MLFSLPRLHVDHRRTTETMRQEYSSTKRLWPLAESNLFKLLLVLFVVQFFIGLGLHFYNTQILKAHYEPWVDAIFFGLNAVVVVLFVQVLHFQDRHYEIDDADEVLRIVNWLPCMSVSAVYPLAELGDVRQVQEMD